MLSPHIQQYGSLLVSEPFMLDPNFKRSVVLLTGHSQDGSVGFILNQRSDAILSDLIPACWNATLPVFIGGPVANDTLYFIHRCFDRLQSGTPVVDDIYWGGDFELMTELVNNNEIRSNEIKFFVGYSGWGEEQLQTEIEQNSWLVTNKYNPDVIFIEDEENLWRDVVIDLGPKYAHIANFPENPMWN